MVRHFNRLIMFAAGFLTAFILNQILSIITIYSNEKRHATLDPCLYVITPTYDREVQKAELTRLANTLMLVKNLHWIIVEDSDYLTKLVQNFVKKLKTNHAFESITHLTESTPIRFKLKPGDKSWRYPKGVWQRNKALKWLRDNFKVLDPRGIVYFADDDNTYDVEVFDEMRTTKRISVWPVGLSGGLLVERPIVDERTLRVKSFNAMWRPEREFPIDMAGFSVALSLLVEKNKVNFDENSKVGYQESDFLTQLATLDQLEPRANMCRKVLVWHTKTIKPNMHEERKLSVSSRHGLDW